MDDIASTQSESCFESAGELRDRHESLLALLDDQLGTNPGSEEERRVFSRLESKIREFVERGAATGVYIEEIGERTACQTLLDYWAGRLSQADVRLPRARLAPFDSSQLPELPDEPCPYVGLETFREADAALFFGRDESINDVIAELRTAAFAVIAGASGSGKSSLVLGGVLPRLRSESRAKDVVIVPTFVPGATVLHHLVSSMRPEIRANGAELAAEAEAIRRDPSRLLEMAGGESSATLIVIDQFEEVFTLTDKPDRDAVTAALAAFLSKGRRNRVILTVRDEFEPQMREQILSVLPGKQVWYKIPELDYDGLRDAILKPAATVNLHIKPEVGEHLVKRVMHRQAALPLLQFTLRSLWTARDRNRITWDRYKLIGGDPLVVLANSARAFLDEHKDPQTLAEIKRILLELIRVDDRLEPYRQPVARSRLLAEGRANSPEVLKLLEKADFVRVTPSLASDDAVVEVKHESLIRNWPELLTWIDEKRVRYRQRLALTDAASQWAKSGDRNKGLLTGSLLENAKKQRNLSDVEKDYIKASDDAESRERLKFQKLYEQLRFRFRLVVALGACAACLLVLVLYLTVINVGKIIAISEQKAKIAGQIAALANQKLTISSQQASIAKAETDKMKEIADQRLLSNIATLVENKKAPPDLRLLQELEFARQGSKVVDPFNLLMAAQTEAPELARILRGQSGHLRAVKFSRSGKFIASGSDDGTIALRNADGRLLRAPWAAHPNASVWSLSFSSDEKTLASAGDTTVKLWDLENATSDVLPHDSEVYTVAFNPKNDNMIAAACKDGTVVVWDRAHKTNVKLQHHPKGDAEKREVYALAFTSDGKLLVSGGADGRIVVWDVARRVQKGPAMSSYRAVFALAIGQRDKIIASGHDDGQVYLWDIGANKWSVTLPAHRRAVYGVAFSHDGAKLATTSADEVDISQLAGSDEENANTTERSGAINQLYGAHFFGVDFTLDDRVAAGTDDGRIYLWDLTRPSRFGRWIRKGKVRIGAEFTGDGQTLIVHANDDVTFRPVGIEVVDPRQQDETRTQHAGQKEVRFVLSPPGAEDVLTIGGDKSNSIERWVKNAAGSWRVVDTTVLADKDEITAAAYADEAKALLFATVDSHHDARIWRIRLPHGQPEAIMGPFPGVRILSLLTDTRADRCAVYFSEDDDEETTFGASLWSLTPVTELKNFGPSTSIALSNDGEKLAIGRTDGTVELVDTSGIDKQPTTLFGDVDSTVELSFSQDDHRLAATTKRSILLWDLSAIKSVNIPFHVYDWADPADEVRVEFSPDSRHLVSSRFNADPAAGQVALWQLNAATLLYNGCNTASRNMSTDEWDRIFPGEPYHFTCPASLVDDAEELALSGDRGGAEQKIRAAWNAVLEMGDLGKEAMLANTICWSGATIQLAEEALPACEKAVEWAEPAVKALYQDSRGVARALTGDRSGAIEDFKAEMVWLKEEPDHAGYNDAFLRRRERWLSDLENGKNPFDVKMLDMLRTENEQTGENP